MGNADSRNWWKRNAVRLWRVDSRQATSRFRTSNFDLRITKDAAAAKDDEQAAS
jgi:hypothetical protein